MRANVSIRNIANAQASAENDSGKSEANRRHSLGKLLPLWPSELEDLSIAGRRKLIAALERALREERRRGREGHWAYDLARHAALHRACSAERADLARLLKTARLKSVTRRLEARTQSTPDTGG